MFRITVCDGVTDDQTVLMIKMETVLAHDGLDFELEPHVHGTQNQADLWLPDLVVTLVIEIDLVDGSASGNDQKSGYHLADSQSWIRATRAGRYGIVL